MSESQQAELDYFGVNAKCGCITAWMSAQHSTTREILEFYRDMATTNRGVLRAELTDEMRAKLFTCPHGGMV